MKEGDLVVPVSIPEWWASRNLHSLYKSVCEKTLVVSVVDDRQHRSICYLQLLVDGSHPIWMDTDSVRPATEAETLAYKLCDL